MNCRGSGDARAKEQVQACLFARIKEASTEEMTRDDLGDAFPLVVSLGGLPYCPGRSDQGRDSRRPWRNCDNECIRNECNMLGPIFCFSGKGGGLKQHRFP